jgi:hypothetical protein
MSTLQDVPAPQSRMWQRIGGLGIVFSILYAVGILALGGTEPGIGASSTALVKYYADHRGAETAAVFVVAIAMVVFAFFLGSLLRAVFRSGESAYFSVVATVGGAVYIGGMLLSAVLQLALVDAAHHHQLATIQTFNFLSQDDWVPFVFGLGTLALATGIAAIRGRTLPRWLAWITVVFGVLCISGPLGGIAFLITPAWTLALGVVLLRRPVLAAAPAQISQPAAATALQTTS